MSSTYGELSSMEVEWNGRHMALFLHGAAINRFAIQRPSVKLAYAYNSENDGEKFSVHIERLRSRGLNGVGDRSRINWHSVAVSVT